MSDLISGFQSVKKKKTKQKNIKVNFAFTVGLNPPEKQIHTAQTWKRKHHSQIE